MKAIFKLALIPLYALCIFKISYAQTSNKTVIKTPGARRDANEPSLSTAMSDSITVPYFYINKSTSTSASIYKGDTLIKTLWTGVGYNANSTAYPIIWSGTNNKNDIVKNGTYLAKVTTSNIADAFNTSNSLDGSATSGNFHLVPFIALNEVRVYEKITKKLVQTITSFKAPSNITVDDYGDLWVSSSGTKTTRHTLNANGTLSAPTLTINGGVKAVMVQPIKKN